MTLSVSIGLALAPQHGDDADAVLGAANIALHHAEADGKNRSCCFEPWMQQQASSRQALETDLRAALALNKLDLRKTPPAAELPRCGPGGASPHPFPGLTP